MTRYGIMTELLKRRKLFKLVCGAGNEDTEEVRRLVFVYALGGAKCFDVSANADVVRGAVLGIEEATKYAPKIKRKIETRPFINVSTGMRGDPHVRKAKIAKKCIKCGACIGECPTGAIKDDFTIIEKRCIGCGNCESLCEYGAIKFYHKSENLRKVLEDCKKAGAEQLELHAAVPSSESIFDEWRMLNEIVSDNYVSMCLDRLHLGDSQLRRRIKKAKELAKDRFIVQADGIPMSGGKDDFNTTLQAVAIADIIVKSKIDVKILLSGGTNNLTARLADMCGVYYNGISIGTFARNIVKDIIMKDNFFKDDKGITRALEIADGLVTSNIGKRIW